MRFFFFFVYILFILKFGYVIFFIYNLSHHLLLPRNRKDNILVKFSYVKYRGKCKGKLGYFSVIQYYILLLNFSLKLCVYVLFLDNNGTQHKSKTKTRNRKKKRKKVTKTEK